MLLLSAILASTQPVPAEQARPIAPRVQAQASVRIMRSASLRVGDPQTLEGKPLRSTWVRNGAGELVPARLAEFE
jgi:hypothetical protein